MQNKVTSWAHTHPDVFVDLIRVYLGIGLMVKAVRFMETKNTLMAMIGDSGGAVLGQAFVAHVIILAHLAGGLFLALGLLTRVAAVIQVPILVGAIVFVELKKFGAVELRGNFDLAVLVLFLIVMIALFGPGRFSVDAWTAKKAEQAAKAAASAAHA
ncbi:MAG TPA: DoxX family membrane protein [Verrucomicrobiae bacterium]|jgi:uncharacterized membrane protein YphA (DoxX/SURF4 family)